MKNKTGEKTGEFGLRLTEALNGYPQYQIYYDHGDPQQHNNVAVIKAFFGEEVNQENKLAEIDVLLPTRGMRSPC